VIVDTHVHVIAADHDRYPLDPTSVDTGWVRQAPVTVEEYADLMDDAGVGRAVLVQAYGAYGHDNGYVVDAAASRPDRFASVVIIDMDHDPAGTLRAIAEHDRVGGVRLFAIANAMAARLDDPRTFPVWEVAAELDLRVVVALLAPQLPQLEVLLRRFPEVPVALDHCGFPDVAGGPPYPGAARLFELASLPNLNLKVTCNLLGDVVAVGGDPRDLVERLAAAFGAERLLWGSDFSHTHDRPYSALVELGRFACSRLASAEQRAFLGENALRLWPNLLSV
jgi:L-fuconolactonase